MENGFRENLKSLRLEQQLTQQQLAEQLKTTQRRISYLEKGIVEPDIETLIRIASLFNVTLDELIIKN